MTQTTDSFKNTQIPLWEDGDIANGANFRQLITAIATMVDTTKTEAVSEAAAAVPPQSSGLTEDQVATKVKSLMDTLNTYKDYVLYTDLSAKITAADTKAGNANTLATHMDTAWTKFITSLTSKVDSYTITGSAVTLFDVFGNTISTTNLTTSQAYIPASTTKTLAEALTLTSAGSPSLVVLTRQDGARFLFNVTARTLTPVPLVIG